jgi:hypothetical protein
MEPGSLSVTRTLPIDAALLGDVLLRIRRDAAGAVMCWNLGGRGSAEIDASFTSEGAHWCATGRIWDPAGLSIAGIALRLESSADDAVQLTLEPAQSLSRWWQTHLAAFADLTRAVVDELAEELLWHAARAGIAPRG